jgi:PAS domain-containing protein
MQALEDAPHDARGLIECCLDLMVTIHREGIITDAHRAAADLTGYPRDGGRRRGAITMEPPGRRGQVRPGVGVNPSVWTWGAVPRVESW